MRTIKADILSWSKDFLELPNAALGGKPVCPYAKKARTSGLLDIIEVELSQDLLPKIITQCNKFKNTGKEICIIACPDLSVTPDELDNYVHAFNHVYVPQDIYLMAFHPEGYEEPVEFLENSDWESDNEFLMVLIQSFEKLEQASASLEKIGFYESWDKDYYESTVTKRKTYRRLLCEE